LTSSHHKWVAFGVFELDFSPCSLHVSEAETNFEALDGVGVALRLIRDTAEDVNHFSVEVTARVVVATVVEHCEL